MKSYIARRLPPRFIRRCMSSLRPNFGHWRSVADRRKADINFTLAGGWLFVGPIRKITMSTLHGHGVELVEARLRVGAFSPHRHDTYTIAMTTAGVQSFNYRGNGWRSLPGQAIILHPDEVHDGYCCDTSGFSYRAAYLPPAHVQTVIGGAALPFLAKGVSTDTDLVGSALRLITMCAAGNNHFGYQDALHELVSAMQRCEGGPAARRTANREAVMRVREFLDSVPSPGTNLDQLEEIAGYGRWQLSRDFRSLLGTSPYRYLQFRRLERARQLLRSGLGMAAAAHEAGFADQSHFGRVFRRTFGTTPMAWHRPEQPRTIIL
ncbi:MAG: AraC family transcriptional regulator [Sphingomonadales bacterium]|nr:MAG: AraC family transcriptional regulator [Sphingomonadales bacterium]